ncbi:MAG: SpoIID/LytB domain-containing protein [Cyanobacteria bacterium P01_F01_bin.116]
MTATSFTGIVGHQPASAADQNKAAAASTTKKAEPKDEKPDRPSTNKASVSAGSGHSTGSGQKIKKSATTPPEPIEPFIQADAVALGQWLVVKTVKTLVSQASAADTAAKKPTDKKPTGNTIATPANTSKPKPAAKPQAAAQPVPQQPPAPKVAVNALPPEPSDSPTIDSYTEMRVAVTKQAAAVTVAASQGGAIVSTNGELIESLPANVGYQISADERGIFINGQPVPTAVWLEPDSGYVAVGDRWYRGRLLLLWQNGGVMAVNYVMLRDYLYSVVGAEMSASWSVEALKAQAVAARSYAIVHTVRHQRRVYDLDDTQRYQAYKGITTEASSTHQAVHETAGEFISYGGGVVESLYAANQDIVNDAHSGYGMSQTGALDLAEQGYLYYEILSAYYPDTSVGRIDISN